MENNFDVRDRLFRVISDFKEQSEKFLPSLEHWEYESDSSYQRKHPRKDISILGIFKTIDSQFRTSTKNVSAGGVLIDPDTHLSTGEDLYMTFVHRKFNHPVRTHGKVVRVDSDGIGIQFDKAIPTMSSL